MGTFEYAAISFGSDLYADDIASCLADIFDRGVNVCGREGQHVAEAFVASGLAREFERQNPVYVAGKSGTELLRLMMPYMGGDAEVPEDKRFERSPDYWLGWVLGLYQVETGRPYRHVFERFSYDELADMYYPLHEAPEAKFTEVLERQLKDALRPTRLAQQRERAGLSQAALAARTGVGLRSIQMYEQRNKDINRAAAATLLRLSYALHSSMEDLLEMG